MPDAPLPNVAEPDEPAEGDVVSVPLPPLVPVPVPEPEPDACPGLMFSDA